MLDEMDEECKVYWKEVRPRMMEAHTTKARERWNGAFGPDYDYEFLLDAMEAKLENMADYFYTLALIDGAYYAGQMVLAAKLIGIIREEGGREEYEIPDSDVDEDEDWFTAEHFIPRVNMRNARRFHAPDNWFLFFCEPQRVRFSKAWSLLMRILSEKMFGWYD